MKKKLLVVAASTLVASSAFAQSAFQGFYGQIATGYENNTITSTGGPYSGTSNSGPFGGNVIGNNQTASGVPLILGLGYTFQVSGPWLVGIGADYSTISQKTDTFTSTTSNSSLITGNQYQISNRYNIFVTPSYAIDKDKLAYLKVGYSSQQLKSTTAADYPDPALGTTINMNGYVLGLGYKQIITGGLYGFAEGNYMSYSHTNANQSWTAVDGSYRNTWNGNPAASAYTLLVGVGYKF